MLNQRLRNLTTGILHTEMSHIYEDIEFLTGETGIMTHHLGMACDALKPYLQSKIVDSKFWNDEFDPNHDGDTLVNPMSEEEVSKFFKLFNEQPNPLFG